MFSKRGLAVAAFAAASMVFYTQPEAMGEITGLVASAYNTGRDTRECPAPITQSVAKDDQGRAVVQGNIFRDAAGAALQIVCRHGAAVTRFQEARESVQYPVIKQLTVNDFDAPAPRN